jgi:hypothetical protein
MTLCDVLDCTNFAVTLRAPLMTSRLAWNITVAVM